MQKNITDLIINGYNIKQMLTIHEIDHQHIHYSPDHKYIQIYCNDEEERDHIKHILLVDRHVLCFENLHKRYFAKDVDEYERERFKKI